MRVKLTAPTKRGRAMARPYYQKLIILNFFIMKKLFTFCLAMATTLCVNAETINNHEYVDLGLPSGLRWATTNVGATNPEDYGNYYAWGETATKDSYTWETYTLADGGYGTLTKYCNEASYGTVDNKTTLEATDDAATQIWGGAWRMPTDDEWQELRQL